MSLNELIDDDDILAEIRMECQSFTGVFLLVEGPTDLRRFEKFIDTDLCSFVNCWAKSKLIKVVKKLNTTGLQKFIALADADFDRARNKLELHNNLLYSENHDFEIDTAHTDVLDRYLKEIADADLLAKHGCADVVAQKIAVGLIALSGAKLANQNGKINCQLRKLNWQGCFDGFELNKESLAYKILRNDDPTHEKIESLLKIIDDTLIDSDLWQITNGHDFFAALGICLQRKIAKRKHPQTTSDEVETHIRLALSESDFRSMALYKEIISWQTQSSKRVLKQHLS